MGSPGVFIELIRSPGVFIGLMRSPGVFIGLTLAFQGGSGGILNQTPAVCLSEGGRNRSEREYGTRSRRGTNAPLPLP